MSTTPHLLDQVGIRFGAGVGVLVASLVASLIATHLAGLEEGYVIGVLLLTCAALGATVPRGYAGLLGLTGWALVTGFVTNAAGLLTFTRSDLELMGGLVLTAVLTSQLATAARRATHRRPVDHRRAA